jgi:hypothetical protein
MSSSGKTPGGDGSIYNQSVVEEIEEEKIDDLEYFKYS